MNVSGNAGDLADQARSCFNTLSRGLARTRPSVLGRAFLNILLILNAFLGFKWITFQNSSGRKFPGLP